MSLLENHRMLLTARPMWTLKQSDFTVDKTQVSTPRPGEVVVKVIWLAFDPAQRGWMNDGPSYAPPVPLGDVMRGHAVGEVVDSGDADFAVGTLVHGNFGWQEYALCRTGEGTVGTLEHVGGNEYQLPTARKVPVGIEPTAVLGVLGTTGLTAYFGMLEIGRPKPGDVVLVSGAAGATGSVAGQIARLAGARTIGIAGGSAKAQWLTEVAKFDAAIDYKSEDVASRIADLAPDGVNVFYDNVAGPTLEAGIRNIAQRGMVVLCGGISSGYSDEATAYGPTNLSTITVRSASMGGFIVTDFNDRFDEAADRLTAWIRRGDIVWADDIQKGTIEDAVDTLNRLFAGKNFGKQILQIADASG
ncbi:NADP-dependent oxidoreductase [Mycolicibacterium sp. P9-64]|uniref:NADP-dependent oxidoreductase n=1 Tax=Mycolicibacterium sp. P9-64 TaxID=2024612 RepID=UPI0011EFF8AF|nr:NADP-dependent oxidoreductase [Mycolicibacterium sp. P9-64]KAA0078861.1 NADP-dependent oxidoreductase [Mycolicibacterium sp. P9-64]